MAKSARSTSQGPVADEDSQACWGQARVVDQRPEVAQEEPADQISAIVRQAAKQVEAVAAKQKPPAKKQGSLTDLFGSPKPGTSPPAKNADLTSLLAESPDASLPEAVLAVNDKAGGQQTRRRSKASKPDVSPVEETSASPLAGSPDASLLDEVPVIDGKVGRQPTKRRSRASKPDVSLVEETSASKTEAAHVDKAPPDCKGDSSTASKSGASSIEQTALVEEEESPAAQKIVEDSKDSSRQPKKKPRVSKASASPVDELPQAGVDTQVAEKPQNDCKKSGTQQLKSKGAKPTGEELDTVMWSQVESEVLAADTEQEHCKTSDNQTKKKPRLSKANTSPAKEPVQAGAEVSATEKLQDECRVARGRPRKKVQEDCKLASVVAEAPASVPDSTTTSPVVPEEAQALLRKAEALVAAAVTLRSAGCGDQAAALEDQSAALRKSAENLIGKPSGDADTPLVKRRLTGKVAVEEPADPTPSDPSSTHSTPAAKPGRKVSRSSPAAKPKQAKCPQDHALTAFTVLPEEAWGCSLCGKEFGPGKLLLACRACDYDICEECSGQASAAEAGPSTAAAQPVGGSKSLPVVGLQAAQPDSSAASSGAPKKQKIALARTAGGKQMPSGNVGASKRAPLDPSAMIVAIQQRHRGANPILGSCLATADEKARRLHKDAAMLGVFRDRFLASGLSTPLKAQMRRTKRFAATLREWASEAQTMSQAEALAAAEAAEEPEEAAEDGSGDAQAPREEKDEGQSKQDQAVSHILERIAETYPKRRPAQMFGILSSLKGKTDEKSRAAREAALQEHRYALVIKTLQKEYVTGGLRDVSRTALHRLPECWALPMALAWEQQLQTRMETLSRAYPSQAPSSNAAQDPESPKADSLEMSSTQDEAAKDAESKVSGSNAGSEAVEPCKDKAPKAKPLVEADSPMAGSPVAPSKMIDDFGQRARGRQGLDPRVADSIRRWLPWGEKWLEELAEIRQKHFTPKLKKIVRGPRGEVVPLVTLQDKLKTLVVEYPEMPPVLHLYCSSEEELTERRAGMMLAKLEKAHFGGALSKSDIEVVAEGCAWLRERLVVWERNRTEGRDPDKCGVLERLGEIAMRHPSIPPSQVNGHVRDLWGRPHEVRVLNADALFLRHLKDRFLSVGLPDAVKEAMRSIPVWGAPRLKEWEVQRDQRSQELWEKRTRVDKKPGNEDGEEADAAAPKKRPREEVRFRIDASKLRDNDVLVIGGQEPKGVKTRKRCVDCHGKTIAEALAAVLSGVQPLTRAQLLDDIRKGLLKIKREGDEDLAVLATPTKGSANGLAGASRRKDQGMYRKLDGTIGTLTPPKIACQKVLPPIGKLTLGDIERLSLEDLVHYESQLGLSARRPMQERTSMIDALQQKNTLQAFMQRKGPADSPPEEEPSAPTEVRFHELTEYERSQLSASDLAFFESKALLAGSGEFSVDERKKRLKEHHHDMLQQEVKKGSVRGVLQFFKQAAEPLDPKKACAESSETNEPGEASSTAAVA